MKVNLAKLIILTCILASLAQGTMHAAIPDWMRQRKEYVQGSVQRKIAEARKATSDLLATLQQNTNCLIRGTCPAEQKRKLRSLAKKIGVTVGVIVAAAAAATAAKAVTRMARKGEEPIDISDPGEYTVVSRAKIAKKYGVSIEMGESPQSLLLQAVDNGVSKEVKEYADSVDQNVLSAGIKLAELREYSDIVSYLKTLHDTNELFLEKVRAGADIRVSELYCDSRQYISSAAILKGINIAKASGKRWPLLYQPIIDFLENPSCGQAD